MPSGYEKIRDQGTRKLLFRQIVRKVFLEDWALKLVALVITLGLWFGVTGLSTPSTKRFTVQLAPNVANNIEITNNAISEVEIVVSGDERKLKTLTGTGLVAALDLTSTQPGDRVISLTPENVSVDLPLGVKLDEIQPSRIAVRLEAVQELELPVKADIEGKPADGFEVYGETVLPQRVKVRGPASFMKTLDFVLTDKISIDGRTEDFTAKQVPLGVSNPKATVFNTVVDVAFRIGEKRAVQTYNVTQTAAGQIKRYTVALFGARSVLPKIRAADIKVEIVKNADGDDVPQVVVPSEFASLVEIRSIKAH
jgi:YbbR domain-containing protein